jgi:hypothetical protein
LEAAQSVGSELGRGDVVLIKGAAGQRLDRVGLALAGRRVGCALPSCVTKVTRCDGCPMRAEGWDGLSTRWIEGREDSGSKR